jgi:sugar/nucleoside kinase (ribokinase family)
VIKVISTGFLCGNINGLPGSPFLSGYCENYFLTCFWIARPPQKYIIEILPIRNNALLGGALLDKRILAFGNPVYDVISTPIMASSERVLSGCSTNACLAAIRLGLHATLVGGVGSDFQARLVNDLKVRQLDAFLMPSAQTGGFSLRYYDDHGSRDLTLLGIADPINHYVGDFSGVDFILIGPILGEVNASLVKEILAASSAPILTDPQGLLRNQAQGRIYHQITQDFVDIARVSTIVKANELETKVVTGIDPRLDPEEAVKALFQFGCKIAVTTIAEAGSIIYDGTDLYNIPAFRTDAIDPTGAGDTYAAGFMVKYLENPADLQAVGCFASAVASVMVENSGPDFQLTYPEAERRAAFLLSQPKVLGL